MQPGGNDVYVVETESGELLVPAIGRSYRCRFDMGARVIRITPLMGMLDESK